MGLRALLRDGMEYLLDPRCLPGLRVQVAENPMSFLRKILPARGVVPLPARAGDFGRAVLDSHLRGVGWVSEATHRESGHKADDGLSICAAPLRAMQRNKDTTRD